MSKTEVGTRKSKFENRNSKIARELAEFRVSNFEFRSPDSELRTLIIGYGNPLRSDDGFGWDASRLLATAFSGGNVEVLTCHQLTPELAESLSRCGDAVFIDADCQGAPGEIHCRELLPEAAAPQSFTHTCTPSGLLASAEKLYGRRPRAVAITVSAQTFEYGDTLSPAVAAALPKVVERVRQLAALAKAGAPAGK